MQSSQKPGMLILLQWMFVAQLWLCTPVWPQSGQKIEPYTKFGPFSKEHEANRKRYLPEGFVRASSMPKSNGKIFLEMYAALTESPGVVDRLAKPGRPLTLFRDVETVETLAQRGPVRTTRSVFLRVTPASSLDRAENFFVQELASFPIDFPRGSLTGLSIGDLVYSATHRGSATIIFLRRHLTVRLECTIDTFDTERKQLLDETWPGHLHWCDRLAARLDGIIERAP
jgi:hypothetical protein